MRRADAGGRIGIFGILILGGIAFGIFYASRLFPIYADDYEVKQALQGAISNAWNKSDGQIHDDFRQHAFRIATHLEDDGFGAYKEMPGLGLGDESVPIERDTVRNVIKITAIYDRQVTLHPIPRSWVIHFETSREGPIK